MGGSEERGYGGRWVGGREYLRKGVTEGGRDLRKGVTEGGRVDSGMNPGKDGVGGM